MLSKYDELMCHQTTTTFDHVTDSGDNWRENVWCCVHDTQGKFFLTSVFGVSTNRNVMDSCGILVIDGKQQINIRASRELRPNNADVKVGPLSYQVIEGLKTVRLLLEENEYGISWDIEIEGRMPALEETPQYARSRGRLTENMCRFAQTGRATGWFMVDGVKHLVDPDTWFGHRDHSWGVRWQHNLNSQAMGLQPPEPLKGFMVDWHIFQFDDWFTCSALREDHNGDILEFSGGIIHAFGDSRGLLDLDKVEHDFELVEGTKLLKAGTIVCTAEDGSKREISIKPIATTYLQAGGYWPYKGFRLGQWMGKEWIDGERLDITDRAIVEQIDESPTVIVECHCDGQIGYGQIQFGVYGNHPKYNATGGK